MGKKTELSRQQSDIRNESNQTNASHFYKHNTFKFNNCHILFCFVVCRYFWMEVSISV